MMVTGIKECQLPEIRSNLIRMIGTLALLLVSTLNDTTANVICAITEFILDQAHRENEVWVLAEAVDTLVDLYSEDETDGLAAKVKLIEKLTVLSPILKNKVNIVILINKKIVIGQCIDCGCVSAIFLFLRSVWDRKITVKSIYENLIIIN